MLVDNEVIGSFMIVADSAGIVIFGKIFSTGKTKDVSTFSKNRFE